MIADKYVLGSLILLIGLISAARGQDCTPQSLAQKPGLLRASN